MASCKDKTALVTGSSRGIGAALARRLAAEGAAVVVTASQLGPKPNYTGSLEETVALIEQAGGRAAAVACDLSDGAARADLVQRASEAIGAPIDILGPTTTSSRDTPKVEDERSDYGLRRETVWRMGLGSFSCGPDNHLRVYH